MRRVLAIIVFATLPLASLAQSARIASDFELAQMEKQVASTSGFEAQLSGRLNLGDVRVARNEVSLARAEYLKALELAERERRTSRLDSHLARYAVATSYAALAHAKLGHASQSMQLLEESLRYASDDAETWNLYASAMRILGKPRKAVAAARNAVTVVDPAAKLDVAVYQHALATSLLDAGEEREAEAILAQVTESLRSRDFQQLQRDAARLESFEVYSSARGDVAAYVSLLNRAQLRLGALYEKQGKVAAARTQYQHVLEGRSDDVTALAALARLASTDTERESLYTAAFEANPFSLPLIGEYRAYLRRNPQSGGGVATTPMQRALQQLERGDTREARATLEGLLKKFPANGTLQSLRREAEAPRAAALPSSNPTVAELHTLLEAFELLTPQQRVALDAATFTSTVQFDGTAGNTFQSGVLQDASGTGDQGVPFRFPGATIFAGSFQARARLTYRVLGVTRAEERDVLLLEPVRLEAQP